MYERLIAAGFLVLGIIIGYIGGRYNGK